MLKVRQGLADGVYNSYQGGFGGGGGWAGGRGGCSSHAQAFGGSSYTHPTDVTNRQNLSNTTGNGYVSITKL